MQDKGALAKKVRPTQRMEYAKRFAASHLNFTREYKSKFSGDLPRANPEKYYSRIFKENKLFPDAGTSAIKRP